jgi:hypothetical protein
MRLRLLMCMLMGMRRARFRSVWKLEFGIFILFFSLGALRFFTYIGVVLVVTYIHTYIHMSPTVAARQVNLVYLLHSCILLHANVEKSIIPDSTL